MAADQGTGFDIGGGSAFLDPYLAATNQLLQGQNQNMNRYGNMGRAPVVLDPNVDYHQIAQATTARGRTLPGVRDASGGNRDWWINQMVAQTGLSAAVWQQVYDSGGSQQPDANAFNAALTGASNTAIPSQGERQWQDQQALNQGIATGYINTPTLSPTFSRDMANWYDNFTAQNNRRPSDQEYASQFSAMTGMDPSVGLDVVQRGNQHFQQTGQRASQAQIEQWANAANPQGQGGGRTPTLARDQLTQQGSQFDRNLALQDRQAQWNAGNQVLQIASNLRGPGNYFQYANMLSGAQGSDQLRFAQQAASGTPSAAFQAWGTSAPATVQGLVNGAGVGNGQASPTPGVTAGLPSGVANDPQSIAAFRAAPPEVQAPYYAWDRANQQASPTPAPIPSPVGPAVGSYTPPAAGQRSRGDPGTGSAVMGWPTNNPAAGQRSRGDPGLPAGNQNVASAYTPVAAARPTNGTGLDYAQGMPAGSRMNTGNDSGSGDVTTQDRMLGLLRGQQRQPTGTAAVGGTPSATPRAGQTQALPWTQPHQLNVRNVNTWAPSQMKLFNSGLQAGARDEQGGIHAVEPEDYWKSFQRAAPKGTAATTTRYR